MNFICLGCNLPLDGQDSSVMVLCVPSIVSSCDKYVLFPFEPAPTSQELPAGKIHWGLSLFSAARPGGEEFTGCKCVGLLWLKMLWKIQNQHLCSHREMATVFPPWVVRFADLTMCVPVVGENWVRCLCAKILPRLVLVHSLWFCQRSSALLESAGLFPPFAMPECWAGVSELPWNCG